MINFFMTPFRLLLSALIFLGPLPWVSGQSAPIHRYRFADGAGTVVRDSVGEAHGVIRGSGASWGDGKLALPGGSSATAAYVDLPNGLLSGLTDVTLETWVAIDGVQNWARIFDFGSSNFAEVPGPGGGGEGRDYFFLGASRASNGNQQRVEIRNEDPAGGGIVTIDGNLPTTLGREYHHVVTYDADGAGSQAMIKYYRDGNLVAQGNTPIQLSDLNDVNNWLGRSNWTADNNLEGTFQEFRIYDVALDQGEVTASRDAGPEELVSGGLQIESFEVSGASIFEGESVTLSWSLSGVVGAWNVTILPSPGEQPGAGLTGRVEVSPEVTTTYTLTASDSRGSRSAEVTVVVDPGVPEAFDQSIRTEEGMAKEVILSANDPNGGDLTYVVVDGPVAGVLTGSPPLLTYTPNPGFTGSDALTFRVNDGRHDSNFATVFIGVDEAPAAPTGITLSSFTIPDNAVGGTLLAHLGVDDPNEKDVHSFLLVPGVGGSDNDLFQISGDILFAGPEFSGEAGRSYAIRLRVMDSGGLSHEESVILTVAEPAGRVVINEVHYDPEEASGRFEFIELFNAGNDVVDLSRWSFGDGVDFTFPEGVSLGVGEYLLVAEDPVALQNRFGVVALGPWSGRLAGDGEEIVLLDSAGQVRDVVDYRLGFPWPVGSGGEGGSMELVNPGLDNELGSSWRVSRPPGDLPEATLLPLASTGWSWRPGSSEASSPTSAWRLGGFVEDASWNANAQAPIGYGSVTGLGLNTEVTDMRNNYSCLFARHTFIVAPGEMPSALQIRSTSDDGLVIWINGVEVERRRFQGEPLVGSFGANQGVEGSFESVTLDEVAGFLVEGENTIAVQLFNASLSSSDVGFDLEIIRPASVGNPPQPTPGAQNSVFSANAPPNIRQVRHSPETPRETDEVLITAKVTDPEGVAAVILRYQVVAPGQFIPSRTPRTVSQIMADPEGEPPLNPAFEDPANWVEILMVDDGSMGDLWAGDGVYAATIPAQDHRTLVRYRIEVEDSLGASVRVPYEDDRSLNFAYFVYNGLPDYVATTRSVHPEGAGHVWPRETLEAFPVYHWLIRPQDMRSLQAYNASEQFTNNGSATELAARRAWDWEGAMVYDGVVYDHIRARLRGGNSRYGDFDGRFPNGKRHYKFRFNRGHYFAAKDEQGQPYERKWRIFNVSRMFGTKGGNSWGLPEELGDRLYHSMGVPTQRAHWFHFRVIDGAEEAPNQYEGDFWGIQQAQERYDVRFLESREMPKGNLYKLSDFFFDAESQRRYQARDMVADGSEFDHIRFNLHGGQTADWLNRHVNYDRWYSYSAVGEAIRHYDIFPEPTGRHRLKNLVWYFEPTGPDPTRGQCWFLPYDYDASWGPSFNDGWDHARNGLYGHVTVGGMPYLDKPEMKMAHRNVLRSFRDLVWQPDQVGSLLDDRAAMILEMSQADQDRWRYAPVSAGTAIDDPVSFKVQDMKNFAFSGWSGGSGPAVGAGGRGAFLDTIADGPDAGQLPATPEISYQGRAGFPTDGLQFQSTAFSDPQGSATFAAMEWRIGEIEDPTAPAWDPEGDFLLENDLIWGSGELTSFSEVMSVPGGALKVGHTYRARVRHKDTTGRFSHWSDPVEFTTGEPVILPRLQANLMITEIMYHPGHPSIAELEAGFEESDFEYLELQNISETLTLDLSEVRFTKGVDFGFDQGAIVSLAPGAVVLVVRNLAAFEMRYGRGLPVAGEWQAGQNLSNGGERLKLSHGSGTAIHDFEYHDFAPWPVEADGDGGSLVLADPYSLPDPGLASSWQASPDPAGSPGVAGDGSSFEKWLASAGFVDPLAEWRSSGLSNLMAYAFGADLAPDGMGSVPLVSVVEIEGEPYPVIDFPLREGLSEVTIEVQVTDDLVNWIPLASPRQVISSGAGVEWVRVRSVTSIGEGPRQFLRVMVTLNQ